MCERLEIRIIAASSPQAKGRVERNNGAHQDRLVKKLRRQGIQSHAATNEYLQAEYLAEHNRRFARKAARPEDYHVRTPSAGTLPLSPAYVRGQAYLALHDFNRAAIEFQKFIDHRGAVANFPWGTVAACSRVHNAR
jgi:hypothetical protein